MRIEELDIDFKFEIGQYVYKIEKYVKSEDKRCSKCNSFAGRTTETYYYDSGVEYFIIGANFDLDEGRITYNITHEIELDPDTDPFDLDDLCNDREYSNYSNYDVLIAESELFITKEELREEITKRNLKGGK